MPEAQNTTATPGARPLAQEVIEWEFVKPGALPDGTPLRVRKPVGGYLAEDGELVRMDSHWLRRKNDGDVVVATPLKKKP